MLEHEASGPASCFYDPASTSPPAVPVSTWCDGEQRPVRADAAPGDTSYHEVTAHNNHTFLYDQIEIVCPKPAAPTNFRFSRARTPTVWGSSGMPCRCAYYKVFRNLVDDRPRRLFWPTPLRQHLQGHDCRSGNRLLLLGPVQNPCRVEQRNPIDCKGVTLPPPCIQSATDGTSTAEVQVTAQRVDQGNYYCFYYSTGNPATAFQMPVSAGRRTPAPFIPAACPDNLLLLGQGRNEFRRGKCHPWAGSARITWAGEKSHRPGVAATTDLTDGVRLPGRYSPAHPPTGCTGTRKTIPPAPSLSWGWDDQTSLYDADVEAGRQYYYWVRAAAETNGLRPSDFSRSAVGAKAFSPAPKVELWSYGATKGTYRISPFNGRIAWPEETYYYRVYRAMKTMIQVMCSTAVPISGWQTETSVKDTSAVPRRITGTGFLPL